MTSRFGDAFQRADAENTGQRVYYTIQGLKQRPNATRKRWVWELLQNAHDARQVKDEKGIIVEIKYHQEELVFLHNGRKFNADEIAHLIRSGSTKDEADETTHGQYGTGLLTTHLLSPKIEVAGLLDDDQWFDFTFMRNDASWEALLDSLDKAVKAFTDSHSPDKPLKLGNFTTRFRLPICEEDAKKAVRTGIETLKQCAPYMLIFNETFHSINIEDHVGSLRFEVVNSLKPDVPIQQITVMEYKNGNSKKRKYLIAQNKNKTSVITPLESKEERRVCLQVENTLRLFKGLPLVDTESFSFPAVINSSNFAVPSTRDGLPLEKSEVNQINREIIEEACTLLVDLIEHAASNKWYYVSQWVKVPSIENQSDPGMDWLRNCVRENLIEEICQKCVILNADDNAIALNTARLPVLQNGGGIEVLWDLLEKVKGFRKTLPRRDEAGEWCSTLQSWANLYEQEISEFNEAFDGRQLAQHVHKVSHAANAKNKTHRVNQLDVKEDIAVIQWLDSLIAFLQKNGLDEIIRQYWIVPSQAGFLRPLDRLHRDQGIGDDLKDIAELLNWRIRPELRDLGLNALTDKEGKGDMDNDEVVDMLCQKLQVRANENPDNNFKEASTRLFAWIVNQRDWNRLQGFPMFTDDSKPNDSPVIYLPSAHTNRPPLAPIRAWTENLKPFSDLFPTERILADAFFEVVLKLDAWKELDNRHLIKSERVIIDGESDDFKLFSPEVYEDEDDKKVHEANTPFPTTDVLEWNEIMRNARGNQDNSYLLWRFLTEYLIKEDRPNLEEKGARCNICGKTHKYYPAKWLKAVRSNKWIRLGDPRFPAEPSSLANLLQNKWELRLLENPDVRELLQAMSIDPAALKRLFISDKVINIAAMLSESPQLARHMEDNEKRHQIEQILDTVGDDLPLVNEAVHDEKFLEEYEKKKKQDLTVQVNKSLGLLVEEMVGEILDEKGFDVESNHRGWDFDMTGHITELKVVQNSSSKTWRVEVKSTRTEGNDQGIYMSSAQAEEAVKYGKQYLLCVVPLGQEDATSENIAEKILFIKNIGNLVAPLCADLDRLKEVRDDITADTSSDLELIVEEGKPRVLVKKPVWDKVGFPLTDLLERLK